MSNKENFYQGLFRPPEYAPEISYSDLFVGYRFPVSKLGATTSAMVANQIMEVFSRLNTGMKTVEAGTIAQETFEKIPKQHFEEINRLAKVTGTEITWHAPIVEIAGIEKNQFSERERKEVENFLWNVIEKVYTATGPNKPITIHATASLPCNYFNEGEETVVNVVNMIDNSIISFPVKNILTKSEIEQIPKEEIPTYALQKINEKTWKDSTEKIIINMRELIKDIKDVPMLYDYLNKINLELNSWAYRETGGEIRNWHELPAETKSKLMKNPRIMQIVSEKDKIENSIKIVDIFFDRMKETTKDIIEIASRCKLRDEDKKIIENAMNTINEIDEIKKKDILSAALKLANINENLVKINPQLFEFIEHFAAEKSAETLSNIALKTYNKFGDKSPILSVENVFPEMAFSRGESLKFLIEKSREKLIEKLKKQGIGEKKAKEIAEKMIGATWDIGHINILKKYGKSAKEIKVEMEKIKPFIKHVHITDNFGFTDSHLPPGMGAIENEIFKEIKELTEKEGIKGILEVPTLATEFGVSPYPYALAALGSPIYSYQMAPFWNQALWTFPYYFMGYGPILPEKHVEIYGASFSGLPIEFGGKLRAKGFSEVPME